MILFSVLAALRARLQSDEGQGLAEYALILVLVAITLLVALEFLAGGIEDALSSVGNAL